MKTMTYEEKIAVVNKLVDKHQLDDAGRMKSILLLEAMAMMGFGRNASTTAALRYVADVFDSEIPQQTAEEHAQEVARAKAEQALGDPTAEELRGRD